MRMAYDLQRKLRLEGMTAIFEAKPKAIGVRQLRSKLICSELEPV